MDAPVTQEYFDQIAKRESGKSAPLDSVERYSITNPWDYLGKYQMGTAALIAAGFYNGPAYNATQIWDDAYWTDKARELGVNSRADFLSNGAAQEIAIRGYTNNQWDQLDRLHLTQYVGFTVNGVEITAQGLLGGAHLLGAGAVKNFLLNGVDKKDANGTPVSSYISMFDVSTSGMPQPSLGSIESSSVSPGWLLISKINGAGETTASLIGPDGNISLNAGPSELLMRSPKTGVFTLTRATGAREYFDPLSGVHVYQAADGSGYVGGRGDNILPFAAGKFTLNADGTYNLVPNNGQPSEVIFGNTNMQLLVTNTGGEAQKEATQNATSDMASLGPSAIDNKLLKTPDLDVGIGPFWDVNSATGNQSVAGFMVTDGLRPGNSNLGLNINASSGIGLNIPAATGNTDPSAGPVDYSLLGTSLNNAAQSNFFLTPVDPLVLDLNGDGVRLTNYADAPVLFDADNDGGSLEQTGWVSAADGIVVHDLNHDGKIKSKSFSKFIASSTSSLR